MRRYARGRIAQEEYEQAQGRITVTLGERPTKLAAEDSQEQGQPAQEALGMEVQTLTKDLAQRFGYALADGVIVAVVSPGGPAAEVGIQLRHKRYDADRRIDLILEDLMT